MILKCLPTGMLASNCYIIGDKGEAAVIDAGVDCKKILHEVEQAGLKIKYIILTHVHLDHIVSMDCLRENTGAKVLVHEEDAPALSDSKANGAEMFGLNNVFGSADMKLKDGDTLDVGGVTLEIIHTPGHTPGGICVKAGESIFTGDTLFRASIGRTDLGRGNHDLLMKSIKEKLMTLDDEIVVYPGHGSSSTIGYERKNNPYI